MEGQSTDKQMRQRRFRAKTLQEKLEKSLMRN